MALDYLILTYISSIGVLQIAAVHAGLRGLWFFRHRLIQYLFGIVVVAGAFLWFFLSEERNYQHTVEGTQQLGLFLFAIITGYVTTALASSLLHLRDGLRSSREVRGRQSQQGFQTLKTTTLLGGILSSLRNTRKDTE